MKYIRFAIVASAMALTLLFLSTRSPKSAPPTHRAFATLPEDVGDWHGREIPLPEDVLAILGSGDYSDRIYQSSANEPRIDLFLGYIPDQRRGNMLHSPKLCLPGAGWAPLSADVIQLTLDRSTSFPANRYVVQRASDRQVVLYWYISHKRIVTDEFLAALFRLVDALHSNRTEAALIRVATPVGDAETIAQATARGERFIQTLVPMLRGYVPE